MQSEAYRKALELQTYGLSHFTYVSDREKSGQGEQFDEESRLLLDGNDFFGDCDTFSNTVGRVCKQTNCYPIEDIVFMVTPNHYIGGVVDDEINDVWVFENTGFEYTRKALNSVNFGDILLMSTKDKYKQGYIEPKVYKLSDLQKGLVIPEKRGRAFMIPTKTKKYYMEQFMTLDEGMGGLWWTQRDDLPFLKDFIEKRDILPVPAEYINSKYWFTKEWESNLNYKKVNNNINWDNYPNFTKKEFTCKCGCGVCEIKEDIVILLQIIRDFYNKPIAINSAYRCMEHNYEVGSSKTSSHPKGYAVDIVTPTSADRYELIEIAMQCGISRIGVYKNNFIHIDCDPDKVKNVLWVG